MPDIADQQTQAAALIRAQIEALDNAAQTLPYWEIYRAISNESGGGGSTDVSSLATEATATAISGKLPTLSSGRIPVSLLETNLTADWRDLTTNTVIPAGSVQIYLKVILGDVTINGLTYSTGEYINLESCYPYKHPEINIVIPTGKSVRLVRGY